VPGIGARQKASLPDTYGPFLGRAPVDECIAAGNVERYFEEHWPNVTVATVDRRIVGIVVLRGVLVDLAWVDPAFRSQGIGSALMADAERRAGGASCDSRCGRSTSVRSSSTTGWVMRRPRR
jgi:GNAT superfamily N-acetyltransferase